MTVAPLVVLTMVVAALALLVVGLLRSHAEILKALHDLGVNLEDGHQPGTRSVPRRDVARSRHPPSPVAEGVAAPRGGDTPFLTASDITGALPDGGTARVAIAGVQHATLLAFLSTGCGTCGVFWEALRDESAQRLPWPGARLVVVTNGPESESVAAVVDLAPPNLVTVMSTDAWDRYQVPVSPYFVLVDGPSSKVVGEGAGTSWEQILDLLGRAAADAGVDLAHRQAPPPLERMRGQDRAVWVDAQLLAAGIEPGDPSLYQRATSEEDRS